MVNSAFTALQDIHGAAMINAVRLAHQSAQNSRMKTLYEYVLGMSNNSGAVGYRAVIDLFVRPGSQILGMAEYAT